MGFLPRFHWKWRNFMNISEFFEIRDIDSCQTDIGFYEIKVFLLKKEFNFFTFPLTINFAHDLN